MKVLVKNIKEFRNHNKIMENKVASVPHLSTRDGPSFFPCVAVSHISNGVNGFIIKHEFVYQSDFTD